MLNKAKERFGFRNVWASIDEFTTWLRVPQKLRSLEIEQKWLVRVMEKICGLSSFFALVFSLLIFFFFWGENYLRKTFFASKFIILFSYNGIAPLIFCFDLISTKILSTYFFFSWASLTVLLTLFVLLSTLNVIW